MAHLYALLPSHSRHGAHPSIILDDANLLIPTLHLNNPPEVADLTSINSVQLVSHDLVAHALAHDNLPGGSCPLYEKGKYIRKCPFEVRSEHIHVAPDPTNTPLSPSSSSLDPSISNLVASRDLQNRPHKVSPGHKRSRKEPLCIM